GHVELDLCGIGFDADQVAGQHLVVRLAREGERLTTLDGKEHVLTPDRLLVCDPQGPLGLAGVMGGASSEVRETTTRVIVEAALWEPTTIRRTSTTLRLRSEASRRFERGIDPELPPLAQRRLLQLLHELTGGRVAPGIVDVYAQPWQPLTIELTEQEVTRILGLELAADAIATLLQPLGFECRVRAGAVDVVVPSFRQDVTMAADLCEEVARMYGYDRLPTTNLADELPEQITNLSLELEQRIRDLLVGAGLDEAITYSLTNMASVARINPADAEPGRFLKLANPLSAEREYMRRSILPTLLEALVQNLREHERVLLFEIGRVYLPQPDQTLPDEPRRLALALAGQRTESSWLVKEATAMDFFDLKGIVESLLARLNIKNRVRFIAVRDDPRFHPGRAAILEIEIGGTMHAAGILGELHPLVAERLEVDMPRLLAAELDLELLVAATEPARYRPISRFPATTQDLAVIVAHEVTAERVEAAIRKYAGGQLETLRLFDVYSGPPLEDGMRSLAYRLAFRANDRTLTDADVNKIRAKIIKGIAYDIQATVRG
ncbi:MAG TPA: phenylalanine--tRNA ligase subunit beta, partial [Roseiflexaceae bacterium]|nr:phenylalanine--tRNA ligase subunit beta [Roseiflexaceae bacterium]